MGEIGTSCDWDGYELVCILSHLWTSQMQIAIDIGMNLFVFLNICEWARRELRMR